MTKTAPTKSTATKSTATKPITAKSTAAKSTAAKSTAAKSTAAKSTPAKSAAKVGSTGKGGSNGKAGTNGRGSTSTRTRATAASATATATKDRPEEPADFSAAGRAGEEVRRLRTRLVIEVLLGAVVLALATALVQVAPARSDDAASGDALPFSAQVTTGQMTLQIDLSPARTGSNELHLTAFDENGLPVKVLEWTAKADNEKSRLEVDIPMIALTENHGVGQADLPVPGTYEFTFTARVSEFDQKSVRKTIEIK